MTPAAVDLSIIIVTWNAKKFVEECLGSLRFSSENPAWETIVVDNASSDGTLELIRSEFPQVKLIENESNLGFAKGNNVGMRASRGRYVCLINSDVNVPRECLGSMLAYMDANREVGVLGPRMIGPTGRVTRSYMRFPTVWRDLCNSLGLHNVFNRSKVFSGILMTDFRNDRTAEVDVLNGWFLMVRREALEEVGLLDERFFMYGEDIDWSYRFHLAGWKRVYFSGASALHYGAASSSAAPVRFYAEMQRANLQFWKKHHTRLEVFAHEATLWLHLAIRIVGYAFVYMFVKSSRTETSMKIDRSLKLMTMRWTDVKLGA
jgi:GT2 family glycosyltransferase